MSIRTLLSSSVLLAALAGCGGTDVILPGERVDFRDGTYAAPEAETNIALAASIPAATNNADWAQNGGNAQHNVQNAAFSGSPQLLFSADIGSGNEKRARLAADPIVAGGVVYTIDSDSQLVATSTAGARLWQANLKPVGERVAGPAGGMAVAGGMIYATSGYGEVIALDTSNGGIVWRQDLNSAGAAAPTVSNGMIYVASRDSRGWVLDAANGRVKWTVDGITSETRYGSGASVAIGSDLSLFPFPSGQIIATFRNGGTNRWNSAVAGERLGYAVGAVFTGVSSSPVIDGGTVYAGNPVGRLAAMNLATGAIEWTAKDGAIGPIQLTGNSLYFVNDVNELVRLDKNSGNVIWRQSLPDMIERRFGMSSAAYAHYGPVMAGGQLYVASSDGNLRQFDPASGALVGQTEVRGGAASNPVVAGGVLYVVSQDGKLLAFR